VVSALDAGAALDLVGRIEPDAVILDMMIPEIDGVEVCRRIRADSSLAQPVIVMLTARVGTEFMVAGLVAGADDYVVKPPNLDELVERVAARLRQRQGSDATALASMPGGRDIAAELRRRLSAREPVAVLSIDLDGFAVYNRRYGLHRGDELLDRIAGLLREIEGRWRGAFTGRLGSDDFVVIAAPTDVEGIAADFEAAYAAAIPALYDDEDAARGWTEVATEGGASEHHGLLCFSIGATTTEHAPVADEEELLQRAVEMERYAKLRQGNRIVIGP
ncbi:MAG TPA: response regulator, partial [Acidimicrobiia bacterium]|nr:response regulator [Acidimicrobiia bacterium]